MQILTLEFKQIFAGSEFFWLDLRIFRDLTCRIFKHFLPIISSEFLKILPTEFLQIFLPDQNFLSIRPSEFLQIYLQIFFPSRISEFLQIYPREVVQILGITIEYRNKNIVLFVFSLGYTLGIRRVYPIRNGNPKIVCFVNSLFR